MFVLIRAFKSIRSSWRHFILIYLELAIGIAVVATSMQADIASTARTALLDDFLLTFEMRIDSYNRVEGYGEILTYQDLQEVETKFSHHASFAYYRMGFDFIVGGDGVKNVYYACLSPGMMEYLGLAPDQIYIGSEIINTAATLQRTVGNTLQIQADRVYLEGTWYTFLPTPTGMQPVLPRDGMVIMDTPLSHAIIIPGDHEKRLLTQTYMSTMMYYTTIGGDNPTEDILDFLSGLHPDVTFTAMPQKATYDKWSGDVAIARKTINWVAQFSLCIICVGTIGVLMQLVLMRKKQLAICVALGASKARLFFELLIETGFYCIWGTLSGFLLSIPFLPVVSTAHYTVTCQPIALLWCIIIVLPLPAVACAISLTDIRRFSTVYTLQNS